MNIPPPRRLRLRSQYWVSQSQKWCEYCKIYIANNAASQQMHEQGQRHKQNVADKLRNIQKEGKRQEREQQATEAALKRIEQVGEESFFKCLQELIRASQLKPLRLDECRAISHGASCFLVSINQAAAQSYLRDKAEQKHKEEMEFIRKQQAASAAARSAAAGAASAGGASTSMDSQAQQKPPPPPPPRPGFSLADAKTAGKR